jgi:hypothetical protein
MKGFAPWPAKVSFRKIRNGPKICLGPTKSLSVFIVSTSQMIDAYDNFPLSSENK